MSGFLTDLDVRRLPNGRHWMLLSPLRYETRGGLGIEVPAGFVTDLASIPRGFWTIFPPVGSYDWAAVIHDYLYRIDSIPVVTQAEADRIMRDAMEDSGTGWWTRQVVYRTLRVFGGHAFHQHPVAWRPKGFEDLPFPSAA